MWFEHTRSSQAITRLYDSTEGLDRVELFEVTLRADGGLQFRVELPRFPDHAPSRWDPDANAVQVLVTFWGVQDLHLEEWIPSCRGVLSLDPADEGLLVAFVSPSVRIHARCDVALIDRFIAYQVWPESEPAEDPAA